MRKALLIGVEAFLLGAAGCSRPAAVPETLVTKVGCVTGSGDEFILTDLDEAGPGIPRPLTEAFLLSGSDREVRAQVGQLTCESSRLIASESHECLPPEKIERGQA